MNPTAALVELVTVARRRTSRSVTLDGLLIGASAALITACAVEASGENSVSLGGALAASLSFCASFATWRLEHRRDELEIARRVDRSLELNGALLSAFERRRASNPLAELLSARVTASLPPDAPSRVGQGPHPVLLGLLFACGATWVGLRERAPDVPSDVRPIVARAAAAIARVAAESRGDDGASDAQLVELAALAHSLADFDRRRDDAAAASAHLLRIEAELTAAMARETDAKDEGRELALEGARELVAAALTRLGRPGATGRSAHAGGASTPDPNNSTLKNGARGSTMEGSARDPASPATESKSGTPPPTDVHREVGTIAGRWWPREYDDVVAAWLDARDQ